MKTWLFKASHLFDLSTYIPSFVDRVIFKRRVNRILNFVGKPVGFVTGMFLVFLIIGAVYVVGYFFILSLTYLMLYFSSQAFTLFSDLFFKIGEESFLVGLRSESGLIRAIFWFWNEVLFFFSEILDLIANFIAPS